MLASDRDERGLVHLQEQQPGAGDRLVVHECDVTADDEVERLVATAIERMGRLDIVCNHVGGGPLGHVADVSPTGWRTQIENTLTSAYLVSHFAVSALIDSRGCVVNTASVSGLGGDLGMGGYNAAKAGLINLTRTMAIELGGRGVRVNAVAPGGILHAGSAPALHAVEGDYLARVPLGRYASPDEIASAIAFLASDDASYITGHCLVVDGGMTASNGQLPLMSAWENIGMRIT